MPKISLAGRLQFLQLLHASSIYKAAGCSGCGYGYYSGDDSNRVYEGLDDYDNNNDKDDDDRLTTRKNDLVLNTCTNAHKDIPTESSMSEKNLKTKLGLAKQGLVKNKRRRRWPEMECGLRPMFA